MKLAPYIACICEGSAETAIIDVLVDNNLLIFTREDKQRIRDRYRGVDTSELEVIPAKIVEGLGESTSIRRVAAYVRVSTDNDEQTSSYELQKNYYTDYIKAQPGWEFVGIYDDEGISGTSLAHRKGMQQLIEDCKAGKIDLILTKSIARFARNIVDCLSVIETLKNLDPPVGVKFEADNIYTLDSNGRMILTILASVAEEESHSKSIIMNWSIDRRFSRGLFLTPALLGYDQDEDGNLVNTRKGFYPDDIAGTFGVPVEEHLKESEVKQIDGYVSMSILTGKAPGTSAD